MKARVACRASKKNLIHKAPVFSAISAEKWEISGGFTAFAACVDYYQLNSKLNLQ